MASVPTQRTLKYLRKKGFTCGVVEYWNHFARRRKDLFNWIDIVALHPGRKGILGVQTTSGSHSAERVHKAAYLAANTPELRVWLESKNRLLVLSWRKMGAKGKRKLWKPKFDWITLELLDTMGAELEDDDD